MLNGSDYLTLARESYLNSGGRDLNSFPFQDNDLNSYSTTNTDWSEVYYDNGYQTNAFLSVMGGKNDLKYYVSGGYYNGQSTVIGNKQERYSIRGKLEIDMSPKFDFSLIYAASYNINDVFVPGNDYFKYLPIYSPLNADGSFRLYNKTLSGGLMRMAILPGRHPVFLNSVAEREENDNRQKQQ